MPGDSRSGCISSPGSNSGPTTSPSRYPSDPRRLLVLIVNLFLFFDTIPLRFLERDAALHGEDCRYDEAGEPVCIPRWTHHLISGTPTPSVAFLLCLDMYRLRIFFFFCFGWQIENEYGNIDAAYGSAAKVYINWAASMATSLDTGVPWVMCQQSDAPDPIVSGTMPVFNSPYATLFP